MQKITVRTFLRYSSLAVILVLGAFALFAPQEDEAGGGEDTGGRPASRRSDADYVIKFSPGGAYYPGTQPYGLGMTLHGMTDVVRAFEKLHPDTRIEILNVPRVREYLVTQLSGGQAPDIIAVNVEDVWVDVQKDWYVPLDRFLEKPNRFVVEAGDSSLPGAEQWWDMFRYQAISRGKAAPDGRNYCITYTMIETGIYYNKTMFRELGLEVPETWEEFMRVLKTVKETGRTPLLMALPNYNDWCADLFFDQVYGDLIPGIDLVSDPTREKYLQGYLDGEELSFLFSKGFFHPSDRRYREIWRLMYDLKQYANKDLVSTDLIREFVTQKAAMIWNASALSYRFQADRELGFEWGVFYMPRFTEQTTAYASGEPMCVIGGAGTQLEVTNSAVRDTSPDLAMEERIQQSKRLKRVIDFLQFMCVPEQYAKIVNEYPCLLPNIRGVEVLPVLKPFERILERKYTTTKWIFSFDLRFSEIQSRMLSMYLTGGSDLEEFMQWQEENIRAATQNLLKRKKVDRKRMERAWREKADIRESFRDLPSLSEDEN